MALNKKQSLKKNYIFQFTYQIITLVLPLVLVPYLTRVIGDDGLGDYVYINSIAYYFVIAANLGIEKYGQRIISKSRNDDFLLRKSYWSLFVVHIFFSFISIIAYIFFALFSNILGNKTIVWIEIIYVVSALFDITWLFYGLEKFNVVVIKSLILKIVEFVLIFLFVKTPDDLNIYVLIVSVFLLLNQLILLPFAIKEIKPVRITPKDILPHFKPLFIFTIAIVATTMYTVFDKTLLGIFFDNKNVAYYEYANKIISIPRTIITVTGVIIYPRACSAIENNNVKEQEVYLRISSIIASFIGFGSLFGLLGVSREFAVAYFGDDFAESGIIMMALSSIPLIVGFCDIFRAQFLLPLGKEKEYTICLILNGILNIIFSLIFIKIVGIYGVVIGTLVAELFGMVFQGWLCRKYIKYRIIFVESFPFLISGIIMFASITLVKWFLSGFTFLIVSIVTGFLVHSLISAIYLFAKKRDYFKIITKSE